MMPNTITHAWYLYYKKLPRLKLKHRLIKLRNTVFFWKNFKQKKPLPIDPKLPIFNQKYIYRSVTPNSFYRYADKIKWLRRVWWAPTPYFIPWITQRKDATEKKWTRRLVIFGIIEELLQTYIFCRPFLEYRGTRFPNRMFALGFQDPATPVMETLVSIHNYIFFYLILIIVLVLWILVCIFYEFYFKMNFPWKYGLVTQGREDLLLDLTIKHAPKLELYWTLFPTIILFLIGVPSFILLYAMESNANYDLTIKIIGHQWYWSYEQTDFTFLYREFKYGIYWVNSNIVWDSNLVYENELFDGEFRLLQVDKPLILPCGTHIQLLITSNDVLHSWAVPSLGVKVDGVPGRLNNVIININREGVFYGQCSELCGVNHGFMPIVVKGVDNDMWVNWFTSHDEKDWLSMLFYKKYGQVTGFKKYGYS